MAGLVMLQHTFGLSDEQVVGEGHSGPTGSSSAVMRSFNTTCRWMLRRFRSGENASETQAWSSC